jgi:hypothetical protein
MSLFGHKQAVANDRFKAAHRSDGIQFGFINNGSCVGDASVMLRRL